jgi:hypothetical protein
MKNIDTLTYTDKDGLKVMFPTWVVLQAIDNLSDEDKADFATAVVGMIGNDQLALTVLKQRCRDCGRFLGFDETCHCMNDE